MLACGPVVGGSRQYDIWRGGDMVTCSNGMALR